MQFVPVKTLGNAMYILLVFKGVLCATILMGRTNIMYNINAHAMCFIYFISKLCINFHDLKIFIFEML